MRKGLKVVMFSMPVDDPSVQGPFEEIMNGKKTAYYVVIGRNGYQFRARLKAGILKGKVITRPKSKFLPDSATTWEASESPPTSSINYLIFFWIPVRKYHA